MCFLTGYYGNDIWAQEYDFLGLGKAKGGHLFIYILFPIECASILTGVGLNLWHGRKNNEEFKKMYAGMKVFVSHMLFMIVVCVVFLGYSLFENN